MICAPSASSNILQCFRLSVEFLLPEMRKMVSRLAICQCDCWMTGSDIPLIPVSRTNPFPNQFQVAGVRSLVQTVHWAQCRFYPENMESIRSYFFEKLRFCCRTNRNGENHSPDIGNILYFAAVNSRDTVPVLVFSVTKRFEEDPLLRRFSSFSLNQVGWLRKK